MNEQAALDISQILTSDDNDDTSSVSVKSETLKSYLPLKRKEFEDEKEFNRFIKSVERLVRGSPEYKEFINFARESLSANVCSFTGESEEETGDVEIHHYPLTLFDIVRAVIDDYIFNDKEFSSFDIASEVINLHFKLNIGFVPLIGTLHKKYHKGNLQIPIEYVLGNYDYIAQNTNIDPELANKIETAKKITLKDVSLDWKPKKVEQIEQTHNEEVIKASDVIKEDTKTTVKESEEESENKINIPDLNLENMLND